MKLRNIDFGNILGASGVQGFFGEGNEYWHHKIPFFHPDFSGMTFVAKTTTLNARIGNMPLDDKLRPKELLPKCIAIKWFSKDALNSIGLSGPGAKALLEMGLWQQRTKPFFISFMSVESGEEKRLIELTEFVELLRWYLPDFKAKIGLQINFSCPNAGLDTSLLVNEIDEALKIASVLDIPLIPKFSVVQISTSDAKKIGKNRYCDALCISNTIPWDKLPLTMQLRFGLVSPLARFGGGGYSGPYLLPLVKKWVEEAKTEDITIPINAGGGIFSIEDVNSLYYADADSIFIGTVAMLRPWRVSKIISHVNRLYRVKKRIE